MNIISLAGFNTI